MSNKPYVALVLGAGSARGLAHIGVIQVLLENQIPFDMIVGSSMGAMVGGIYASGADMYMLDHMIEHMNQGLLYDVNLPRLGFMAGNKINTFLDLLTKKQSFDQLQTALLVVATDLVTGERVVIEEGSVTALSGQYFYSGNFSPGSRWRKDLGRWGSNRSVTYNNRPRTS